MSNWGQPPNSNLPENHAIYNSQVDDKLMMDHLKDYEDSANKFNWMDMFHVSSIVPHSKSDCFTVNSVIEYNEPRNANSCYDFRSMLSDMSSWNMMGQDGKASENIHESSQVTFFFVSFYFYIYF